MSLPADFVYLHDVDPTILQEIKYFSSDNFVGCPVAGYEAPVCILTRKAATILSTLQQQLRSQALGLKVFDGYRPQTAVDHFVRWSQDSSDQKMKQHYYPRVNKADLFRLNYISEKSGHTRGSTVDLTLVRFDEHTKQPIELDMGTIFDFLDEASHPFGSVEGEARQHRMLLLSLMQQAGFVGIDTEWWHFTLKDEPYPDTYFNFPVK